MDLTLELPPEQKAEFRQWAAQQGEALQRDAERMLREKTSFLGALGLLFLRANNLLRPILDEAQVQEGNGVQYLLLLLKTMTALSAKGGLPYTFAELARRTPLEDAITLYELQVVSQGLAARLAGISRSEFIEALGKAGVSAFQYSAEEVLAEAEAA